MAMLEREVGVVLLERVPRGIRLTPAGELLAKRTEALLAELSLVEDELRRLGAGVQEVHLGAFPTAGADLVPMAIRRYRDLHPDIRVVLTPAVALILTRAIGYLERRLTHWSGSQSAG
jgi:DNA-binding transcriptional LysR family regulator